jgi:hypothetical protein
MLWLSSMCCNIVDQQEGTKEHSKQFKTWKHVAREHIVSRCPIFTCQALLISCHFLEPSLPHKVWQSTAPATKSTRIRPFPWLNNLRSLTCLFLSRLNKILTKKTRTTTAPSAESSPPRKEQISRYQAPQTQTCRAHMSQVP